MRSAVIIDAVRTPVARAHAEKGMYRDVRADDLSADLMKGLLERTGLPPRSEEHTSELQSHLNLVCRLLLEKKKDCTSGAVKRQLRCDKGSRLSPHDGRHGQRQASARRAPSSHQRMPLKPLNNPGSCPHIL